MTPEERIASLERQVIALAAKLEQYHEQACVLRAVQDAIAGDPASPHLRVVR